MEKKIYPELTMDFVRVTEASALMSSLYLGCGNLEMIKHSSIDAMRGMFDYIDFKGNIVMSKYAKENSKMLYVGEKVGSWQDNTSEMDLAVDAIDGVKLAAFGLPNAISAVAATVARGIKLLPTFYSFKLAVGRELKGKLDLRKPMKENIKIASEVLGIAPTELTFVILNRQRHEEIIEEIKEAGSRIKLISDGDITAAIATAVPDSGVDIYVGIGGTLEGILSAAALKTLGGEIQMKLWTRDRIEEQSIKEKGWDLEKIFYTDEIVGGEDVIFSATGITDGDLLKGVKFVKGFAYTHTLTMRSKSATIRKIESMHNLKNKTIRLKSLGEDKRLIDLRSEYIN